MICDKEGPTKWEDALSPSNKEPQKNVILDSSMVEHSAVNRVVVGSSPTRGVFLRPHGQAVKTSPFHGGNTGSIPVGVIFFIYKKINMAP